MAEENGTYGQAEVSWGRVIQPLVGIISYNKMQKICMSTIDNSVVSKAVVPQGMVIQPQVCIEQT